MSLVPEKRAKVDIVPKDDDDDDGEDIGAKKKRRRIIVDSDEENVDGNAVNEPDETPSIKTKKPKLNDSKIDGSSGGGIEEKLKAMKSEGNIDFDATAAAEDTSALSDEPVVWLHSKLDFIRPENMKDKSGRRFGHADYDPSTLYVPPKYLESLTPVRFFVFFSALFSVFLRILHRECVNGGN